MNAREMAIMIATYQAWAHSVCAPLFWEDGKGQTRNGSMTLLRTDEQVLGITNAHVAEALAGCKDENGYRCQVGGACLDPNRLIAKHPSMDLATFRLSEVLLGQIGVLNDGTVGRGAVHQPATVTSWPPVPPNEESAAMYGGYPGAYRSRLQDGNLQFGFFWFATKVQTVSERNVGLLIDPNNSISLGKVKLQSGADLGGWSGGPVFRVIQENSIERLQVSAIIYEYSTDTGIVLAHPLTDLKADGTFN
jgi:hypothetical protein